MSLLGARPPFAGNEYSGQISRGIAHNRHVPTAAALIHPVDSWSTLIAAGRMLHRGSARQIDYRFWIAANATDKVQEVQLWGLPWYAEKPSKVPNDPPLGYLTGVGDHLATLSLKHGGTACANKNPITGLPDTLTWHQASFVNPGDYRINVDAIKLLRNVDDDKALIVRTDRLIYSSFIWHGSTDIAGGATEFMTEAFLID